MVREMRNCKRCGKVFLYTGVPICPECVEKEERQFSHVKKYLDEHPRSGVSEISEGTGVPVEVVIEFLRQGLLVSQPGPEGQLTCIICKRPITKGRICAKCEATLKATRAELSGSVRPQEASEPLQAVKSRMYVMDLIGGKKRGGERKLK